jgi:hypothetical protein
MKLPYHLRKQRECLLSWVLFYKKNEQWGKYHLASEQLDEFDIEQGIKKEREPVQDEPTPNS